MRILKYVFLLLLLALVAVTVFVATQKGTYDIVRTRVIKSPRQVVYDYVNDYRNWEHFGQWAKEDKSMKFDYPENTSGQGGSYSWISSDGEGQMQTVFARQNDSISQRMLFNGSPSQVSWKFKDTIGGTKVTWRSKGRVSFGYKIYAVTRGGVDKMLSALNEQSLANLDKILDYEINTFTVAENGVVTKSGAMYLCQTITSKISDAPRNLRIMLSKMTWFFKKNKIQQAGQPFAIWHSYNTATGLTNFSVGIPIKEEIRTSPGSDITFGKFEAFRAAKVTLKGDYSHRPDAWKKADIYLSAQKLQRNPNRRALEVFSVGIDENKAPSKWVTHLYIPLEVAAATVRPVSTQTTVRPATTPVTPSAAKPQSATPVGTP